jgi:AmmeMemoRadiSam system protein A
MPSTDAPQLSDDERQTLLDLARRAVAAGCRRARFAVELERLPARLGLPGASFVTLKRHGELRGCMGRLEATRPLAEDVAGNAQAAACQDPRFPPLSPDELDGLHLEVSVLSATTPIRAASEAELLAALRPGVDGLIIEEGGRRATFLPAVWAQLPEPRAFLAQLRRKAGLPPDRFDRRQRYSRYVVDEIS